MTTPTLDQTIEAIAAYESWKEDALTTDPDVSLTAYIRVLEAGQPDPRIAEIHALVVDALDRRIQRAATLADHDEYGHNALAKIAKLTAVVEAEVEVFTF